MTLQIVDPGFLTTVQDVGRHGWARYGIPPSGPMDAAAASAANILVGNPADAALLEITLLGPALWPQRDVLIAVCGATFELWAGELRVPAWHAVFVRAGHSVRFAQRQAGARAYLAVAGGIAAPPFLGSRATYLPGGFGGWHGRALQRGDRLPIGPDPAGRPAHALLTDAGMAWPRSQRPAYTATPTLRVVLGPQHDAFEPEAIHRFLGEPYTVTPRADRMGIRLQGRPLAHRGPAEIVSDGLVTGSVQVPPDGQPIVMMVDHQTTGGYPKIATVIRPDLPLLAQSLPGDVVRFAPIGLREAQALLRQSVAAPPSEGAHGRTAPAFANGGTSTLSPEVPSPGLPGPRG